MPSGAPPPSSTIRWSKVATELQLAERGLEPLEAQCQTSLGAGALDPTIHPIGLAFEEEVGGEIKGVEDFGVASIAIREGDQFNMAEVVHVGQGGVPPQERSVPLRPGPKHHAVADLFGPKRGADPAIRPVNDRHIPFLAVQFDSAVPERADVQEDADLSA